MRIRTGHKPEDWTPNIPAHATHAGISGTLVTGKSAQQLHRESVADHKAKVKAAK